MELVEAQRVSAMMYQGEGAPISMNGDSTGHRVSIPIHEATKSQGKLQDDYHVSMNGNVAHMGDVSMEAFQEKNAGTEATDEMNRHNGKSQEIVKQNGLMPPPADVETNDGASSSNSSKGSDTHLNQIKEPLGTVVVQIPACNFHDLLAIYTASKIRRHQFHLNRNPRWRPRLNILTVYNAVARRNHIREKLVFIISLCSLILMANAIVTIQWLLPYYYAISAPLLIGLRIGMYIKYKWQYFLIDFCYFGNTLLYIFIWVAPYQQQFFAVVFALSNGPLAWATVIFRNSTVFHSTDKMTSVYIHVLPLFLTYGIRWFPEVLSQHWYTGFVNNFTDDVTFLFVWLVGVAFGCFMFHTLLYLLIVYAICRPDKSYLNSYRYLSTKDGWTSKALNILGQKYSFVLYSLFNWLYCILSLLLTVLLYKFFIAHSVFLAIIVFIVAWNGVTFYMDVFPVKGFHEEA